VGKGGGLRACRRHPARRARLRWGSAALGVKLGRWPAAPPPRPHPQHNFTLVVLGIVAVSVVPVALEVLAARREAAAGGGGKEGPQAA
jgi:hypothetical protein